jgi:adenylate kinase family enzyme
MQNSKNKKARCILVMGGPCSGKGTYCKKLAEEFGLIPLSVGDVLREARLKEDEDGIRLDQFMKEFERTGKLMPMEEIVFFLEKAIYQQGWEEKIFLIDGLIKAKGGYDYWKMELSKKFENKFVLYLECSKSEMLKRMKERSKSSGRLDDNENIFSNRIETFFKRTYPCIEMLRKTEKIVEIDTERVQKFVYKEIKEVFTKYFEELISKDDS